MKRIEADFNCDEEEPFPSDVCVFHDLRYIQSETNCEEHKQEYSE